MFKNLMCLLFFIVLAVPAYAQPDTIGSINLSGKHSFDMMGDADNTKIPVDLFTVRENGDALVSGFGWDVISVDPCD